nr:transposase [Paenibacillus xylanivorans]
MCKYHIVFTPKYRRKEIYNHQLERVNLIATQVADEAT